MNKAVNTQILMWEMGVKGGSSYETYWVRYEIVQTGSLGEWHEYPEVEGEGDAASKELIGKEKLQSGLPFLRGLFLNILS